jgi:hypothetical protein
MTDGEIDALAKALLPSILMKELPRGYFRFGAEYCSPSPFATGAMRDRTDAIIVNGKGQWRDNDRGVHGVDIVSLLSHLRKTSPASVRADLMRTLNPNDATNGQPIRPGLTARSKAEDASRKPNDDDTQTLRILLNKAAMIQRSEGISKADALVKLAMQQRKRR